MRRALLCDSFDLNLIKSLLIVEQFQYQESGLTDLHCFGLLSRLRPVLAVTDSESTCVSPCPSDPPRTRPGRSAFACILIPSVTFDFQGHSSMNFTT